jgi:hypothetical protein
MVFPMITVAQIIRSRRNDQMTVRNSCLASECGIDSSRNTYFLMVLDSRFRGNDNPERGVWHSVIMQNKANSPTAKMNAKGSSQRDYENKTGFAVQQNKPKQSQFSNRKTDDRKQKAEYSPRSSVIRPRSSVRERQAKHCSGGQNEESSIFLLRPKIGYN